MKPIIYVYTETYYDAKRLFNTLFRPSIDREMLCNEELWEHGESLQIESDTEIWRIYKKD